MLLQKQIDCYNVETERKINHAVFELYGLSSDEITYVTKFVTQSLQSQ